MCMICRRAQSSQALPSIAILPSKTSKRFLGSVSDSSADPSHSFQALALRFSLSRTEHLSKTVHQKVLTLPHLFSALALGWWLRARTLVIMVTQAHTAPNRVRSPSQAMERREPKQYSPWHRFGDSPNWHCSLRYYCTSRHLLGQLDQEEEVVF